MPQNGADNNGRGAFDYEVILLPAAEAVVKAGGDGATDEVRAATADCVRAHLRQGGGGASCRVEVGDARLMLYVGTWSNEGRGPPDLFLLVHPDDIDAVDDIDGVPKSLRGELLRNARECGLLPELAAN
jgi:hypothetical protein